MCRVIILQIIILVPCKEVLTFPLRQHYLLALQTTQHCQDPQHEGVLIDDHLTVQSNSEINLDQNLPGMTDSPSVDPPCVLT